MLEKILILRIFPKDETNFSAYTIEFFNLAPTHLEMCQSIKYSIYQTIPLLTSFLTDSLLLMF